MSNGKGSARRPRQVSRKEFDRNWDAVFCQAEKPTCNRNGDLDVVLESAEKSVASYLGLPPSATS